MRKTWIHETGRVNNSSFEEGFKCYRNAVVLDSSLGTCVTVGDDTTVARSRLGNKVALNRRSYVNDSIIGNYTYCGSNNTINFASIGSFCSLARNVDIGGFDHDYNKVTTMPAFRFEQLISGQDPDAGEEELCKIGNDVWIAAGAQILHKASVGDGAVIGGGAVVTKDIPPYAIAVGVPAKIIKYRFPEKYIEKLLFIKWWDWPEEIILENIDWMIKENLTEKVLEKMETIHDTIMENAI